MKILVTSTPGTGHVQPLVPIARALVEAGHELFWATSESGRSTVEAHGFTFVPAGMSLAERTDTFTRTFVNQLATIAPDQRRSVAFAGHFATLAAPRMFEDLSGPMRSWKPDIVIHETAELAGPVLAEAMGIAHATVAFSGEVPRAAIDRTSEVMAPLWHEAGVPSPPDLGMYLHAYFHPFPRSMGQRPLQSTVHDLGPFPPPTSGLVPTWLGTLDQDRPLIYVTFGTEMSPVAPWRLLNDTLGSLDAHVLVTIGTQLDPATVTVPTARIERFVPQEWILPHCRLVISHAGAGTLLGAARHGVPQLLLPIGADQFENSSAYAATGAGAVGTGLDADDLAALVRTLLGNGPHRTAAASLADEISRMPTIDDAVAIIESMA